MNGFLNVYKPSGCTSFKVVSRIKGILKKDKVGHTGTLDPIAKGVLPICIGKATKLSNYVMSNFKIYTALLKLGVTTDTYDREGNVLKVRPIEDISDEDIKKSISKFVGQIKQIPPMYSALKVNGKRLYELARKGIEVTREPRDITIYEINIDDIHIPFVKFTVRCSKGTYIRSLCYDIGEDLGCGASMWELERIQTGMFNKYSSVSIDDLNINNIEKYIIPIEEVLSNLESAKFDAGYRKKLLNGVIIDINDSSISKLDYEKIYKAYVDSNFIGIGKKTSDGFKMLKLLV